MLHICLSHHISMLPTYCGCLCSAELGCRGFWTCVRPMWCWSALWCCSSLPAVRDWTGDAGYPPVIWHSRGMRRRTRRRRRRDVQMTAAAAGWWDATSQSSVAHFLSAGSPGHVDFSVAGSASHLAEGDPDAHGHHQREGNHSSDHVGSAAFRGNHMFWFSSKHLPPNRLNWTCNIKVRV